jgi:hypothetical protein
MRICPQTVITRKCSRVQSERRVKIYLLLTTVPLDYTSPQKVRSIAENQSIGIRSDSDLTQRIATRGVLHRFMLVEVASSQVSAQKINVVTALCKSHIDASVPPRTIQIQSTLNHETCSDSAKANFTQLCVVSNRDVTNAALFVTTLHRPLARLHAGQSHAICPCVLGRLRLRLIVTTQQLLNAIQVLVSHCSARM